MIFRASVLTLYPDMFPGPLGTSLAGRAIGDGIFRLAGSGLVLHRVIHAARGVVDDRDGDFVVIAERDASAHEQRAEPHDKFGGEEHGCGNVRHAGGSCVGCQRRREPRLPRCD